MSTLFTGRPADHNRRSSHASSPGAAGDVTVYFDEADKDNLLKLNTPDVVTFRGRTSKLAGLMSNHELVNGKIVALQFGKTQVSIR